MRAPAEHLPLSDSSAGSMGHGDLVPHGKVHLTSLVPRDQARPEKGQSKAPDIGVAAMLRAARRRWILALVAGLVLGGVGLAAAWCLSPPKYTSACVLRVATQETQILPDRAEKPSLSVNEYKKTQLALVRSRPVLQAALETGKVRELAMVREQADPLTWLEKELKVGYVDNTELLRISLSGEHAADLPVIVNAVKDAYLKEVVGAERNELLTHLNEVEKISVASEEKVRSQRELLRKLAETLKTSDSHALTLKQRIALEEYATAKREFNVLQAQIRQTRARTQQPEPKPGMTGEGVPVAESLVEQYLDNDPRVLQQLEEVRHAEETLQAARAVRVDGMALPKHQKALEFAQERLKQVRVERRDAVVRQLRQQLVAQATVDQEQLKVQERQLEALTLEVARLGQEAERIGTTSFELELKRNEVEESEAVLKKLRLEKQRLEIEVQSTKPRVRPLATAEVPEKKNTQSELQTGVMVGIAGFILGVLGVAYWEYRGRWIHTSEEVSAGLGLKVIGTIPVLPRRLLPGKETMANTGSGEYWQSLVTESIAGIRTMLLCDEQEGESRVLMVTSAREAEGKTTLASLLAGSIARAGHKTLLVDADLRVPKLHLTQGLPLGPGLSDALCGEVEALDVVRQTSTECLSILTAGQHSGAQAQALSLRQVKACFDKLRTEFEYLIIDAPPVLSVADSLVIGKQVDTVLLSIRPGVSNAPTATAALGRLRALGIKVFGAVVNGVHSRDLNSHYLYPARPVAALEGPVQTSLVGTAEEAQS